MKTYEALKDTVHPLTLAPLEAGGTVELDERAARYAVLKGDLALKSPVETPVEKPVRKSGRKPAKAETADDGKPGGDRTGE